MRSKSRIQKCKECGFDYVANNHKEFCTKGCYSDWLEKTPKRIEQRKREQAAARDKSLKKRLVIEDAW